MKTFKQILKELTILDKPPTGGGLKPPKPPISNRRGGGGGDDPPSHDEAVDALKKHFEDMHGVRPDKISSSGEGPTRTTIISHSRMPGVEMSVNGGPIDPVLLHSKEVSPNKWENERIRLERTSIPKVFRAGPDLLHNLQMTAHLAKEKAENERLHPGEIDVVHHPDVGPVVLDYDEHNNEYRAIHINSGKIKSLKASYHPDHHEAKNEFRKYVNSL